MWPRLLFRNFADVAMRNDSLHEFTHSCNVSGVMTDCCADNNCTDSVFPFCEPREMNMMLVVPMVFYSLVVMVGLYGNILVIYTILQNSKMHTVTNIYILNLAVADILLLSNVVPLLWTMGVGSWPLGNAMCKVYVMIVSLNRFASSKFLTVMSLDRYIAVCYPLKSMSYRTTFVSKVVCITGWTISFVMMVPVVMYANEFATPCMSTCSIALPHSDQIDGGKVFILSSFALEFAIPLVLMSVFSSLVTRELHQVGPRNNSEDKKNTHHKVTKLVLTIIIVYVFCWLPFWIGQVALVFEPAKQEQSVWEAVYIVFADCLSTANSAINPILYTYLSDSFKKSFFKLCLRTLPET